MGSVAKLFGKTPGAVRRINGTGDLDVSKINGQDLDELLLDLTPETPVVAFSLRRLSKAYKGNCLRVRESLGNTETDIGFTVDGVIDTAAIASHCGPNSGYVVKIYDQSSNGNDATAPDTARQPLIYDAGTQVTLNSKPAFDLLNDAGNRSLNTAYSILNASTSAATQFIVGCTNTGTPAQFVKIQGPPAAHGINGGTASTNLRWSVVSYNSTIYFGYPDAADIAQGTQYLVTEEMLGASGTFKGYHNGTLIKSGTNGSGTLQATRVQLGGGGGRHHTWQEFLFYDVSITSRTDIEDNIDTYYNLPT